MTPPKPKQAIIMCSKQHTDAYNISVYKIRVAYCDNYSALIAGEIGHFYFSVRDFPMTDGGGESAVKYADRADEIIVAGHNRNKTETTRQIFRTIQYKVNQIFNNKPGRIAR